MLFGNAAATILLLGSLAHHVSAKSEYKTGVSCVPCENQAKEETCTIVMKVNFFSSSTGYFEFEGCDGVNPNLQLTVGKTYLFDQTQVENWYHLIGFAYEPDGAHVPVDELEPGVVPPGSGSTCNATLTCPSPMYMKEGVYQGAYSNDATVAPVTTGEDDFGLDAVEPLFFHPLGDWKEYGAFKTSLKFDDPNFAQDFFYFCHIHAGMSGRVKLVDDDGNMLSTEDTPVIPYEYDVIKPFDKKCGTFNLTDFADPKSVSTCPDEFLCGSDTKSVFAECVEAMDCHMMSSMTTNYLNDNQALFCHQMIPHHQNAVNMAKSLLYNNDIACALTNSLEEGEAAPWQCELRPILVDIINTQNSQIIDMRDALDQLDKEEYANCEKDFDLGELTQVGRRREEKDRSLRQEKERNLVGAFVTGKDCEPCAGEPLTDVCNINAKINLLAGELGYFEMDGCDGVNPVLHLTVGKTYTFTQKDSSNWYHLIGFAYLPDGAHVPVDELEPGVLPPGSASKCRETSTCPAPMYWKNGEYQGKYSNIDELIPVTTGEDDFGLDEVEPLFFWPLGDWTEEGGSAGFVTALKFDIDDYKEDFFYFCHVHAGMSGRVKLKDAAGNMLNSENTPELYDYDVVSEYDEECGSYGLVNFQTSMMKDQCPSSFVCGGKGVGSYSDCIDSMNCAMLDGMTTFYGGQETEEINDAVLFLRQMIPHHRNAVNMAKGLLKNGDVICTNSEQEEGSVLTAGCLLQPIARGIINTQNSQIITMQDLLIGFDAETGGDCDSVATSGVAGSTISAVVAMIGVAAFFL